jgi:hypothetical protein
MTSETTRLSGIWADQHIFSGYFRQTFAHKPIRATLIPTPDNSRPHPAPPTDLEESRMTTTAPEPRYLTVLVSPAGKANLDARGLTRPEVVELLTNCAAEIQTEIDEILAEDALAATTDGEEHSA